MCAMTTGVSDGSGVPLHVQKALDEIAERNRKAFKADARPAVAAPGCQPAPRETAPPQMPDAVQPQQAKLNNARFRIRRDLHDPITVRFVCWVLKWIDIPLAWLHEWIPKASSFAHVWLLGKTDAATQSMRNDCCDTCPFAIAIHGRLKCAPRLAACGGCTDWKYTDIAHANKLAAIECPLPGDGKRFDKDPRTKRRPPVPGKRDYKRGADSETIERLRVFVEGLGSASPIPIPKPFPDAPPTPRHSAVSAVDLTTQAPPEPTPDA